ncbi:toxin-antitoxin system HicB family antitoxin [Nocardia sp. NPDC050793]|uniref:toxin-antitoxin system HicB family antitoxin n=1 Tax=Nocardia sp. NPDC050793 TaxID=3155159 RepID=UPI0034080C5D
MDLRPYIESLRHELTVAVEAGGDQAQAVAGRLLGSLESAVRLTLLNVLSNAADEITRSMAPGSVELRLSGVDPRFVVTPAPLEQSYEMEPGVENLPAPAVPIIDDSGGTARINLRLPDQLKARAEDAAAMEGLSVNAWLVRAVAAALESANGGAVHVTRRLSPRGDRHTGWAR